ncbi:MAG: BatD family protein [Chloroflexi bacterium]|nr:BatD family protein [Chloroflexota bacterium]
MMKWLVITIMLLLVCSKVRAQDAPTDYYIEASVDNPTPFVGQQIGYTVRVYEAVDLSETSPLYEPPDFEGLWRVDIQPMPYAQSPQQINGRTYIASEIRTALYPTRAGDITIAPARVILPETVFRPEQQVESNAVTLQVQPLPEGAPPGFNGAVGQFELTAALDRQSLTLGEPVTLRLTVRGTGNVEQLPPPEVSTPEGWQQFTTPSAYTATQDNGRIIGEKVFEWVIVPNQPGVQELPAISFAYFDPAALAYRTLNTAPTIIEVLPGNAGVAPPLGASQPEESTERMAIKPAPAAVINETPSPTWLFWLLWLIPPAAAFTSAGWLVHQQRRSRNRAAIRRSAALARAEAQIQMAASHSPQQLYRVLREAIISYFGDKLNAPPSRIGQDEMRRALAERPIPPEVSRRVLTCLERANEGQYGPASTVDARQLARYTADTLKLLDAAWEAK